MYIMHFIHSLKIALMLHDYNRIILIHFYFMFYVALTITQFYFCFVSKTSVFFFFNCKTRKENNNRNNQLINFINLSFVLSKNHWFDLVIFFFSKDITFSLFLQKLMIVDCKVSLLWWSESGISYLFFLFKSKWKLIDISPKIFFFL